MSDYIIYGLADPDTHEIRYIGMSAYGLKRPRQHFRQYNLEKDTNKHKTNWIKSIINKGKLPEIIVLAEARNKERLNQLEIDFIEQFKPLGRLTNLAPGGFGGDRGGSEITRRAITGKNIKTGEIRHYVSSLDTKKDGFDASSVIAICRGRYKSSKGWVFCYAEENIDSKSTFITKTSSKPVMVTILDTNEVKIFKSAKDAAKYFDVGKMSITKRCKGYQTPVNGKKILRNLKVEYYKESNGSD